MSKLTIPEDCEILDARGQYVGPGFVDIHTHSDGNVFFTEQPKAVGHHLRHGTTTVLAALYFSMNREELMAALGKIREAMADPDCKNLAGVYMEGPYLSMKQVGARHPDYITPPKEEDYLPLLEKYGKYIARVTYAPENDTDQKFTKALMRYGILPSVGHSDATYEELLPAFKEGCTLVTHLYSCTSTITRQQGYRHLGII